LSPLEWCTVVVPPANGVGAEEGEVYDASAEGRLMTCSSDAYSMTFRHGPSCWKIRVTVVSNLLLCSRSVKTVSNATSAQVLTSSAKSTRATPRSWAAWQHKHKVGETLAQRMSHPTKWVLITLLVRYTSQATERLFPDDWQVRLLASGKE